MRLARHGGRAPEERRRGLAPQSVALVRPLPVVEPQEGVQRLLQSRPTGEVAAAELDAPMLLEDRALEAFHKAVGPGMPRPGPGVPNAEGPAGVRERPLELRAPVGEDPLQGPASPPADTAGPGPPGGTRPTPRPRGRGAAGPLRRSRPHRRP